MRDEGSRSLKKEGSIFDKTIIKHEHQAPSNVDYQSMTKAGFFVSCFNTYPNKWDFTLSLFYNRFKVCS